MHTLHRSGQSARRLPALPALCVSIALLIAALPADAALLSGYFRHNAPGVWVNYESRQTAVGGPLSDSNVPIPQIAGSYTVDYGSIRVSSQNLGIQDGTFGFSNAGSSATFQDSLTISSPGIPPYMTGTMIARLDVSGSLMATGNGQSLFIVDVNAPYFGQQITGAFYGPTLGFPPTIIGEGFGSHLLEIPFIFSQPFSLSVTGSTDATVQMNDSGSAHTNLSNTIGWGGILEIRDEFGAILDFSVVSESGYDYATVQAVPLPASAWLLVTGLAGLVARRRLARKRSCRDDMA